MSVCLRAFCVFFGLVALPAFPRAIASPNPNQDVRLAGNPVVEQGVLESAANVPLHTFARRESTIVTIISEGSKVKKGDRLVELSNPAAKETLVNAENAVIEVTVRLKTAEAAAKEAGAVRDVAMKHTELLTRAAKLEHETYFGKGGEYDTKVAELKRAIESAKRAVVLADADLAEDQTSARLKAHREDAVAQLQNAEGALRLLNGRQKTMKESLFELRLAEANAAARKENAEVNVALASARAEREAAQTKVTMATQRLRLAQKQVASLNLVAPQDGVVYHENTRGLRRGDPPVIMRQGTVVRERQTILRVIDMSRLQVRIQLHESKIRRVRKGQQCDFVFDALPGKNFEGSVLSVARESVPGAWPNEELRVHEVVVSLTDGDRTLVPGLSCTATFQEK